MDVKEARKKIITYKKQEMEEILNSFDSLINFYKKEQQKYEIKETYVCELFYLRDYKRKYILHFKNQDDFHQFIKKVRHPRGAEFLVTLTYSIVIINGGIHEFPLKKILETEERLDVIALSSHVKFKYFSI